MSTTGWSVTCSVCCSEQDATAVIDRVQKALAAEFTNPDEIAVVRGTDSISGPELVFLTMLVDNKRNNDE